VPSRREKWGLVLDSSSTSSTVETRPWWRAGAAALTVLIVGLGTTAAGAVLASVSYQHSEQRLVNLEARLSGLALTGAASDIQLQLAPPARIAAEGGTASGIERSLPSPLAPGGFALTEVLHVSGSDPQEVASTGQAAASVVSSHQRTQVVDAAAAHPSSLVVGRLGTGNSQHLLYALGAQGQAGIFVVFAEQAVPGGRRVRVDPTNPGANLNFAIYFGRSTDADSLLETNAAQLPIRGTRASTTVPFGDESLSLVISPRDSLAGGLSEYAMWMVLGVGLLFTGVAAGLVERTARGRRHAEALALQNRELFEAQRDVAQSLQHALLPKTLPDRPDLEIAVRYLAGTAGMEVGGDWYDVIEVDGNSVFFTVGDVAGRGLDAAILMGSLRSAINAYAAEGDNPEAVLSKLDRLVDLATDGRFATVICGRIDLATGVIRIANAGHPHPLLVHDGKAEVVAVSSGPPVGVGRDYEATTLSLPPGGALLAYTDGLVERRSESINRGIDRLRVAAATTGPLSEMLDRVLDELVPEHRSDDDVALLGIRWTP